jgi:predicted GIY-YIG superfamily endonuclease
MGHWIYILECDDEYIYIGETTRLFRRFREHIYKNGAVNTHLHKPYRLIGLYKLGDNYSFYQYRTKIKNNEYDKFIIENWGDDENSDNLLVENHFTELFMHLRKDENNDKFVFNDGEWNKVRGGKYTKEILSNPTNIMDIDDILDRPLCNCGLPCEVKLSNDKTKIYFVCAIKNVWTNMEIDLDVDEPCEFFQVYNDDVYIKKQYELIQPQLKEQWIMHLPISAYKINPEPCISCNKQHYVPLWCFGKTRRVCQSCFSNKYDILKEKYDITSKCMITDDD